MFKPFQTVAVLGAGVMGSQIAAHLANVGLTVHLLDIASQTGLKNDLIEGAWKKALKLSPPILFTEKVARRIKLGNFDEHFDRLRQVDWVIEAVVEDLQIKQQLMERLETVIQPETIVSTNTSGIPIRWIAKGQSESFRKRFLGTHFFNPPRYLKLLELIPTQDTDSSVLDRMKWFGELYLGKGVVIAKDTPNFIANRIGIFVTLLGIKAWIEQGYSIEEIDTLTGTLIGRPKSATFRTADLVGLDTLVAVADHLYQAAPNDEHREIFQVPDVLRKMVASGMLGAKTGQGFYKKQQGQILSINPKTFTYEAAQPLNLGELDQIAALPLRDRIRTLYATPGRAGDFFRQTTLEMLNYSAHRVPEIADDPQDIDRAMRWGFGWDMGVFELWDVLETVVTDEMNLPTWVKSSCYSTVSVEEKVVWQNAEAALLDMDEGVLLYEFRSKGNTLSNKVLEGFTAALSILETSDYKGLVIGNKSDHFSGGANLAEMAMMAQSKDGSAIATLILEFQQLLQRIHYSPKPIIAAIQGRVLGGGCELVMACPKVVAAAETYIGLVEVGVGLIPGAGGLMRMASRAAERAATETPSHVLPFLRTAFETIATAKVSTSAAEAQILGFLPYDARILINGEPRLEVAKAEVLHLDLIGYRPPSNPSIFVLGQSGRAALEQLAYVYEQGGFASAYDRYLASRIAFVLTGGELTAPALVSEDYLLQLERESFVPLLSQEKTQARMLHLLKTKKPLRN
ncbi:3-hydroxyacyl-CoA dehydrogenase NAD-binding domain-containing protein [Leptolyngbya sp. AN03gr2]|uniref:3-hydroxyacyl-CoA dehydrogenase/enoyl-CoA hydratase family protein n=1 Tax=unclassified Leptolyngbya TaxID=2650499 RepID=UPI003D310A4D